MTDRTTIPLTGKRSLSINAEEWHKYLHSVQKFATDDKHGACHITVDILQRKADESEFIVSMSLDVFGDDEASPAAFPFYAGWHGHIPENGLIEAHISEVADWMISDMKKSRDELPDWLAGAAIMQEFSRYILYPRLAAENTIRLLEPREI